MKLKKKKNISKNNIIYPTNGYINLRIRPESYYLFKNNTYVYNYNSLTKNVLHLNFFILFICCDI